MEERHDRQHDTVDARGAERPPGVQLYSIKLIPDYRTNVTYVVTQRFETERAFFKALYRVSATHNYLGNDLETTIKLLTRAGYTIVMPNNK